MIWSYVYDILDELLAKTGDPEPTMQNFFSLTEAIRNWVRAFIKFVAYHRVSCNNTFKRFGELMERWARRDFETLKKVVFDECHIINCLSPIILDSDQLGADNIDEESLDRLNIVQPLMLFLDTCTCEHGENIRYGKNEPEWNSKPKKEVKAILKQIYKQPGLAASLVFNLHEPSGDDEKILSAFIAIVGNMVQY